MIIDPHRCTFETLDDGWTAYTTNVFLVSRVVSRTIPETRMEHVRTLAQGQLSTLFAGASSSCANLYNNFVLSTLN